MQKGPFFLLLSLFFWAALSDGGTVRERDGKTKQNRGAGGEPKKAGKFNLSSSKEPITIHADTLEVDYKRSRILYKGSVVATQGNTTLQSDTLTANYLDGFKDLKEAIAQGHVRITEGERVATSGKAVFSQIKESVVMTENPTVRQGGSEVTGSKITLYVEEERTVVEGGSQRVKAIIHPEQLKGSSQ
jgi:lipopolysaccharide export system protein LptA